MTKRHKDLLEQALSLIRQSRSSQDQVSGIAEELGEDFLPTFKDRTSSRKGEPIVRKKFHIEDAVVTLEYRPGNPRKKWSLSVEEGVESVG